MPEGFLLFCEVATILCATGILFSKSVFNSTLLFLSSCLGIAGVFYALDATYLFVAQIAVYGGGIVVLFLFAIMIAGRKEHKASREWSFTGLIPPALLLYLLVSRVEFSTPDQSQPIKYSAAKTGELLSESYLFPFELSGVLLLVALIGAILISLQKPESHEQ